MAQPKRGKLRKNWRGIPPYTTRGCPYAHNRTPYCFQLCEPVEGIGQCGRLAPFKLRGRTQRAIDEYKARKAAEAEAAETEAVAVEE